MSILNELRKAGLQLSLEGEQIKIENAEHLTDQLRNLIRNHKCEIVSELSKPSNAIKLTPLTIVDNYPKTVICYTPLGDPLKAEATDAIHEAYLLKMNPKPTKEISQ